MAMSRTTEFSEYDPRWPQLFAEEARALKLTLGPAAVDIVHVGSTAVPGMPGKGIIDILITVPDVQAQATYAEPLAGLGYIERQVDRPDPFFTKPAVKPRIHNVHITQVGSQRARSLVAFRDLLRNDKTAFDEYAVLKRRLTNESAGNMAQYSRGKEKLATRLEEQALADADDTS